MCCNSLPRIDLTPSLQGMYRVHFRTGLPSVLLAARRRIARKSLQIIAIASACCTTIYTRFVLLSAVMHLFEQIRRPVIAVSTPRWSDCITSVAKPLSPSKPAFKDTA